MFWIFDIILSHFASAAFSFSQWIVWNYYFKQQLTQYLCVASKTAKLWAKSQISLTNILVTRMHSSRMHTAWTLLYGGGGRSPWQRPPWTEIPLDRDPPGQRPSWTEPPLTETPLDREPPSLDRDPPGQRPPGQRPPCVTEWHTGVKTLPSRNFVADGKKGKVGKSRVFVYNF